MGKEAQTKSPDRHEVRNALWEAEREHWLDCQNAPLSTRLASSVLDIIFVYLVSHGFTKLVRQLVVHGPRLAPDHQNLFDPQIWTVIDLAIRISFLVLYLTWSVSFFGGTLGKLLLGLRVIDCQTGHPLTYRASLFRGIASVGMNVLVLFTLFIRPDRRGLHDLFSNSVVKKVRGTK
ncbi:MAG: hypothetical protein EBQ85_11825 [Proteobacteria bacterium]|nr:hypothetical protein [Pseudomonadota bacterium]